MGQAARGTHAQKSTPRPSRFLMVPAYLRPGRQSEPIGVHLSAHRTRRHAGRPPRASSERSIRVRRLAFMFEYSLTQGGSVPSSCQAGRQVPRGRQGCQGLACAARCLRRRARQPIALARGMAGRAGLCGAGYGPDTTAGCLPPNAPSNLVTSIGGHPAVPCLPPGPAAPTRDSQPLCSRAAQRWLAAVAAAPLPGSVHFVSGGGAAFVPVNCAPGSRARSSGTKSATCCERSPGPPLPARGRGGRGGCAVPPLLAS